MSFATFQNSANRISIQKVVIKLDFCENEFGVSPCTATGQYCYNTFFTCKDKLHFEKITKEYKFTNNTAPQAAVQSLNALPYVESISFMSTEIQDDKTITPRVTITLVDDVDYDATTDPYWMFRNTKMMDAAGTYLKKLIARNPFYRGRTIEIYDGFVGLAPADFQLSFTGKIENITKDGNRARIECINEIADLSKKKYPLKSNYSLYNTLGKCFDVQDEAAMLKLNVAEGDNCIRRDFKTFALDSSLASEGGALTGLQQYLIVAYNAQGLPFAHSGMIEINLDEFTGCGTIALNWDLFDTVYSPASYKVFGRALNGSDTFDHYFTTTGSSFSDDGSLSFSVVGTPDPKAYRLFEYLGNGADDINNWNEEITLDVVLDSVTDLDETGYLQIDDEIIFYDGFDDEVTPPELNKVQRLMFSTKADEAHYEGTAVNLVVWETPQNPFTILTNQLIRVTGTSSNIIDLYTLAMFRDGYTGINMSCKPVIKEIDAAQLIFDLCFVLDIDLWQNEAGLLTIRSRADETIDHYINDADNIIVNSESVDFNQDEIFTRCYINWDRLDVTKGNSDKDNFKNTNGEIDYVAEGPNMYDKDIPKEVTTLWINEDCGTPAAINTYLEDLLNTIVNRTRLPRPKLTLDVELKDSDIKVGDNVALSGDAFQNIDGTDYSERVARVIKKEPKGNKYSLTIRLFPNETPVTTTSEQQTKYYSTPVLFAKQEMNEVRVTGLVVHDNLGNPVTGYNNDVNLQNFIDFEFDNMYASQAITATKLDGTIMQLQTLFRWVGNPPHPASKYVDTGLWQTTKRYNVYLFVANVGDKFPVTKRPTIDDANGFWYLLASIPDKKNTSSTFKYKQKFRIPAQFIGKYIAIDVYADTSLLFDSAAPVGTELEALI